MLENCHLCSPSASELKTGTDHFLVAARVEFGTGNRHGPFFGRPRGVQLVRVVGRTRRAVAPMPGRWCGRGGGFDARQVARQECGALGVEATLGEPSNEVGRAIKRGWVSPYSESLGEPVLRVVGRVGQASTKGPLGEPVLTTFTVASTFTVAHNATFTVASTPASKLRLLGAVPTVPAQHRGAYGVRSAPGCLLSLALLRRPLGAIVPSARSALQVPARHWHPHGGTVPARHRGACLARLAPARRSACSARLPRCPLSTAPPSAHREVLQDVHLTGKESRGEGGGH